MKLYSKISSLFFFASIFIGSSLSAQDITVHDPVMIKQKDTYYLFCTGKGISVFSSKDLKTWNKEPQVFTEKPIWADGVADDFKSIMMS